MIPKEKAEDLVLKHLRVKNDTHEWFHKEMAKQCALITVNEMYDLAHSLDDIKTINYLVDVEKEIKLI